jgi:hypothetical protein
MVDLSSMNKIISESQKKLLASANQYGVIFDEFQG